MFRLAYRLFAGGSILLACASACADGKFHFYNSLDDKLPFRVSLSAGQSKPTMKSENLLEYHGEPWTCCSGRRAVLPRLGGPRLVARRRLDRY